MARKPDNFDFNADGQDSNTGNVTSGNDTVTVADGSTIDPVAARDNGATDSVNGSVPGDGTRRGRGRPRGSGNRKSTAEQKAATQDIGAIQALLLSVHGAIATQIPEMEISENEAKILADNIIRVEQYYPKLSNVLTGKVAAHVALLSSIAAIYGPRVAGISLRMKRSKEPSTVHNPPFRTVSG